MVKKLTKNNTVVFNKLYAFDESVYKKVWLVTTDEFDICGTVCVMLKVTLVELLLTLRETLSFMFRQKLARVQHLCFMGGLRT